MGCGLLGQGDSSLLHFFMLLGCFTMKNPLLSAPQTPLSKCSFFHTVILILLLLGANFPASTSNKIYRPFKNIHEPAKLNSFQAHQQRDWLQKIGSSNFTYRSLATMLSRKKSLVEHIGNHIKTIQQHSSISPEVLLKVNVLLIYQRELNAAENSLMTVLRDFNQTLSSDYSSIENIKKSCKMRQEDMRNAAVLVEEDYNAIVILQKEMSALHPNISLQSPSRLLNEFLSEISHAADTLESKLVEDVFNEYKNMKGAGLETVVKLSEESLHEHKLKRLQEHPQGDSGTEESSQQRSNMGGGGISMLIDSNNNQYILSRPRDVTFPIEDHHFIHDIIHILLLSFVFGGLCSLFKVPSLFGYIFAGMVLGPTGWNLVGSVVQVETLGEVGVIFIVFMVGLDFSFQKLKKVSIWEGLEMSLWV